MLGDVVPSATLRVYQPLVAFPPEEQARWERYIVGGGMLRREPGLYRQRTNGKQLGILAASASEGADVRLVGDTYFVCPWRTKLLVLMGLASFREAGPFEGSDAFVSDREIRRAVRELARIRRKDPSAAVPFVLQSAWHVPVRWFTLFADGERRIVEGDGGVRLTYLTTARKAMRRAERAIPGLRRSDLGPLADLLVELHGWLRSFDPRSLVELDYGGLCDFLTWDELDDDHSARDVQEAARAYSSGELPRSVELYQNVVIRWAEVRGHESLN
jgi:hypothetical protein